MIDYNNNFGYSLVMVWEWAGHTLGRTLGLGLGWLHCGKNAQFWTGLVTLWEEHSVLDWASHIVGKTLGLGLGQSHCGNNTWFGTGPVMLWKEHRLRVCENEAGEDIRA